MRATTLSLLAAAGLAVAQRPSDTPICDYYTTALLKDNTAKNQYTLLQLLVNTVVIGNYTQPNVGVMVPGILAKGTYNGTEVNLLPYFDGMLASSNRGGDQGVSVNFLDGGGATPIMNNTAANSMDSNQYKLLTHLYQYFGYLLGCTQYGMGDFPAYSGHASMFEVHRFMDLDAYQVGYFIQNVGLAAASFGVAQDDIMAVAMALNKLFGYKCSPPVTVIPAQGDVLESICVADSCPLDANATCSSYPAISMPASASGSMSSTSMSMPSSTGMSGGNSTGGGSMSMTPTMGSPSMTSAPAQQSTNAAPKLMFEGAAAAAIGGLAFAFAL